CCSTTGARPLAPRSEDNKPEPGTRARTAASAAKVAPSGTEIRTASPRSGRSPCPKVWVAFLPWATEGSRKEKREREKGRARSASWAEERVVGPHAVASGE